MRQSLSHPTACSCDIWGVLGVLRKQDCKETLRLEEEDRVFFFFWYLLLTLLWDPGHVPWYL